MMNAEKILMNLLSIPNNVMELRLKRNSLRNNKKRVAPQPHFHEVVTYFTKRSIDAFLVFFFEKYGKHKVFILHFLSYKATHLKKCFSKYCSTRHYKHDPDPRIYTIYKFILKLIYYYSLES